MRAWILAVILSAAAVIKAVANDGSAQDLKGMRDELLLAVKMPEESQKALLKAMGTGLVLSNQWECNLFGGTSSCVELPSDSALARTCGGRRRTVDCAFKGEALEEMADDPQERMREKLAKEGYPPCEQCFDALHAFWCGQTAPTCGTFEEVLDEVLPAISNLANQKVSPGDALGSAFPKILQAFSLGLPCREMCEAVTSTCGCGHSTTVGQVLTSLDKEKVHGNVLGYSTNMSAVTEHQLFVSVWNQPVCNLFAPKSMPGFIGVCDVPPTPVSRCGWCKSKQGPSDADEQIVAQVAQSMSGMMQAGLERVMDAASSGRFSRAKHWDWNDEEQKPAPHHSGWWVALVLFLLVGGGGAAVAGVWFYQKRRHAPSQYVHLDNMGYDPPVL